jgi:hypothetical protein
MGGGGSTQTQKSEPSDFIKPYLSAGLDEAKSLFGEGPAEFYQGSTVPTDILNATVQRGMGGAQQRAGSQYALDQFSGGGLLDTPAIDNLRSLGNSNSYIYNPAVSRLADMSFNGSGLGTGATGRVGDLASTGGNNLAQFRADTGDIISGNAQAANPALSGLGLTAAGGYLNSNPHLDATFGKAADQVARSYRTATSPAIDSAFARSSGALRSGAALNARDQAEQNLGRTLSGLATDVYGGNYQAERGRQEAATANLGNLYQSGLGLRASTAGTSAGQGTADAQTRLAASGQITGAQGQDAANQLAANAQLSQAYESGADRQLQSTIAGNNAYNAGRAQQLQGLGMQPAYQQMDYADLGAAQQAKQTGINADIARWDYEQNAPWANLQRYMSMVSGGSPGQSTSITTSGGNPLAGLFAGAGGLGQLALGLRGLF